MNEMNFQSKFEILIVDDSKNNLLALSALLERDDLVVYQALSGTEALEMMLEHDFCLAFLDVQMPNMSGFELAEMMRGTKKTKNVPIIFVTATATDQRFSFKGYESGAVDFLLKPLDSHAVKSKANVFIELYRQKMELKIQLATIEGLVEALNLAKFQAERATTSKSEFLANMSHEIRTPIGVILGFTDLMKNPINTPEENRAYMVVVERNSQHLLTLIDEILDLSKVETGKMLTENIEFSLADMLADFSAIMVFKAEEKGISFKMRSDELIPDIVSSDPVRLRQILNNIGGNAIKFTDKGQVDVAVSYTDEKLKFIFKDTGIGMTKSQEMKLFQPFTQADTSTTRKFGGNGLGLALSRRLAEILGGRLDLLTSRESVGSTFSVEVKASILPHSKMFGIEKLVLIAEVLPNFSKSTQLLRGLKVLLIEDSPDNQTLISLYLRREGAFVDFASDGAQGAELALAGDFDVLLMDIQMPILDGNEATKKLRSLNYSKPIVALTAHAMQSEKEKCFDAGFDEFLTKPIQKDVLIEVLSRHLPI